MHLWRAVDDEGEVLDVLLQSKRDKRPAVEMLRRLIKNLGTTPVAIVTDGIVTLTTSGRRLGGNNARFMQQP